MITREAVVAEAMTWKGTRWHHKAAIKGVGVDCAQFLNCVYSDVGLIRPIAIAYPRQWALHQKRELFLEMVLSTGAIEIDRSEADAGDIGLWKFGNTFSHGAILISKEQVIHAVIKAAVQIDELNRHQWLIGREAVFFTLWDKA